MLYDQKQYKGYEKYKINNIPDYIVISKKDKFWSDENIKKDNFNIFLENENFKVYSKKLLSVKCK